MMLVSGQQAILPSQARFIDRAYIAWATVAIAYAIAFLQRVSPQTVSLSFMHDFGTDASGHRLRRSGSYDGVVLGDLHEDRARQAVGLEPRPVAANRTIPGTRPGASNREFACCSREPKGPPLKARGFTGRSALAVAANRTIAFLLHCYVVKALQNNAREELMITHLPGMPLPTESTLDITIRMTQPLNVTSFSARQKVTQYVMQELS